MSHIDPSTSSSTSPPKPTPISFNYDTIPAYLRKRPQWVLWKYELTQNNKQVWRWTKVPYQMTGAGASSIDPTTWTTFEVVLALVQMDASPYDGIGYMIAEGEDLQGIDIDHCLDAAGTPNPEAASIIATLNSYTEVSPSGNGLRIWCFGTKPGTACKKALPSGAVIEMYEKTRYLTVTGHHLEGTPPIIEQRQAQIEAVYTRYLGRRDKGNTPKPTPATSAEMSDEEVLRRCRTDRSAEKFLALYDDGHWEHASQSEADFALMGRLYRSGAKEEEQLKRLFRGSKMYREEKGEDYLMRTALKIIEGGDETTTKSSRVPPSDSTKLTINTTAYQDWHDLPEETFAELVRINAPSPELFRRGLSLVRVRVNADERPAIQSLKQDSFAGVLAEKIRFVRDTVVGRAVVEVPIPPPRAVVENLLARKNWTGIPALRDIIHAPIFTEDGVLISRPGYHEASRLWYAPTSALFVSVPDHPTVEEIQQARDLLVKELLGDFPFDGQPSRAHAVAMILLPFARELIPGPTPLHALSAPSPGAGKGLLLDVVSLIATGQTAPLISVPRDDEEMRKRITAQLRRGTPIITLDNLNRKLDSSTLASALTARQWDDRVLGVSEMTDALPVRVMWVLTGNNPEYSGEIARRTITCHLDPKVEQPWKRNGFRHPNLETWVRTHRPELVSAALTLVRGWLAAGRPAGSHQTIGSFESWADTMAGILDHTRIGGFMDNFDDVFESATNEAGDWTAFTKAWAEVYGNRLTSAKHLYELARGKELLGDVYEKAMDSHRVNVFGGALSGMKGRVFAGHQIVKGKRSNTGQAYQLVPVPAMRHTGSEV